MYTHDVGLSADRNKTVYVLTDWHEDFAGHVSAFLGAGGLILDVDAGSTLLDEELGELHYCRETAMAGICVGDDGPQVVHVGDLSSLRPRRCEALFPLLAVVEELCHP